MCVSEWAKFKVILHSNDDILMHTHHELLFEVELINRINALNFVINGSRSSLVVRPPRVAPTSPAGNSCKRPVLPPSESRPDSGTAKHRQQ